MVFRSNAARPGSVLWALGTGLLVAGVTSGGIIGERLSEGSVFVGVSANVVATFAALFLSLYAAHRRAPCSPVLVAAQAMGAFVGIVLVHLAFARFALGELPWLSERPAQWVNDLVAAFGLLVLVAALSNRVDWRGLAIGAALVLLYRQTAEHWHLDHPPHGFEATVQQLVVAQFASIAVALLVFRWFVLARRHP